MTLSGIPRALLERAAADPSNASARETLLKAAGRVSDAERHEDTSEAANGARRATSAAGQPVTLVLPLPPSVNSFWRSVPATRNRIAKVLISEQGRRFKRACQLAAAAQCATPMDGDVSLRCVVYFKDRRRDLDNVLKPLLDALNGIVYRDDRQVAHLEFTKRFDVRRPRVELVAAPL